ncbi:MAG: alpha-hydroxy-acid oxidizing enzyme [Rhodospirillaceae bacterium]|nr:alpha-hydroxy-acid oxidizing enzyme [Rhodospirillaceae bacterium]|tara:strand:- start:23158 stop:24252 length:1095 start_codon:yes stop_codon:yes gene_type:complete
MSDIETFTTLQQIAVRALRNLNWNVYDYLMGGSETETTLKRNRQGFDALALAPRILRNVANVDPSVTFMGKQLRTPVMLAPIGSLQLMTPDGGLAAAQAAAEAGTITILSSVTNPEMEDVGPATNGPKVYQLYVKGDDDWIDVQVKRAIDSGFEIFCLTVDTAIYSRRERDLIKRWAPSSRQAVNDGADFLPMLSWETVKRFKDRHDIPLILKGIGTGEDAEIALQHGIECIYVSNHGGRQLDHGRGSIEVLPEVVEVAKGKSSIVMDGSILRGTDVIKAMALGADAVCIGKLQGLGLAAGGKDGLVHTLRLLEEEIRTSMALLGLHDFSEIDASFVEAVEPLIEPSVTSPYTHIEYDEREYER